MSLRPAVLILFIISLRVPCAAAVVYSENFDTTPFVEKHWIYLEGYESYDAECNPTGNPIYVDGWVYNNMSRNIPGSWYDYLALKGWPICESLSNVSDCTGGGIQIKCRDNPLVPLNQPMADQKNQYDWQQDLTQPGNGCFKTAIPQGWTIAFDWWADNIAYGPAYQRGKMGASRIANEYAYSGGSLHMWSAHGNMRVVSPPISAPAGAYRLTWKSAVWNLGGPDAAIQSLWTDWAQWGWGNNNWENPWGDLPYPPLTDFSDPSYAINVNHGWYWHKDPYHDSDPEGYIDGRPDGSTRPTGEEAGVWQEWSREFIVPTLISPFYVGFNCGHAHDPWNAGCRWGTILNVDDLVLEDVTPYERISEVIDLPNGTLVVLSGKVVTATYAWVLNNVDPWNPDLLFVEEDDRSSGIGVQYDSWSTSVDPGDRVYIAGVLKQLPTGPRICPCGDGYAVVKPLGATGTIDPVWLTHRDIAGGPIVGTPTAGLLARTAGKVTKVVGTWPVEFVIDDGSAVPSGLADFPGLRVKGTTSSGIPVPTEGSYVVVTGVGCLWQVAGQVVRMIRPRAGSDVVILP